MYVDAVGQFLKLILHQNHVNKYNVYNQVGPTFPRAAPRGHAPSPHFEEAFSKPLKTAPSGGTLSSPGAATGQARTVRPRVWPVR